MAAGLDTTSTFAVRDPYDTDTVDVGTLAGTDGVGVGRAHPAKTTVATRHP